MQTESQYPLNTTSLWALLVGIDTYKAPGVPPLRGSVNDVEAMRQFLVNQLGVPADHIRTLTNEQATRAKILHEFQEFLIGNRDIKFNDQILFHFSGHGSQMPNTTGTEPDGLDETIVAYDSRTSDPYIYDIPDKTIAALLKQLAQKKGDRITVILNSCHSGSGTRRVELPGAVCTRLAPSDTTLPPIDLNADIKGGFSTRGIGPSGWARPENSYVLLAACRDRELAREYRVLVDGQEVNHGVLTYFILQALRTIDQNTTYGDLHESVCTKVNAEYPDQTPQCEGDRDRQIFGGTRLQRDPFIIVKQIDADSTVVLQAGLVSGLYPGTELELYAPDTRTLKQCPAAPLASVEVVTVTATSATARFTGTMPVTIPPRARAVVTKQAYPDLQQTVALVATEGHADQQAALTRLHQEIAASPYLKIVDDPALVAKAQKYVKASADKLSICNANGDLLVEPFDQRNTAAVRKALESIVRYNAVLTLENPASQLNGMITLQLLRGTGDQQPSLAQEEIIVAAGPGGELIATYYPEPERQALNTYTLEITNTARTPVYVNIFGLSPDYSIVCLYESGEEALEPDVPLHIDLSTDLNEGWNESRDRIKAFVTVNSVGLKNLEQDSLNVPIPTRGIFYRGASSPLLDLIDAIDTGTRAWHAKKSPQEDWTTVTLPVTTVRATQTVQLASLGEKTSRSVMVSP